jgi:hypothetical protein
VDQSGWAVSAADWFPQNVIDVMAPILLSMDGVEIVVQRQLHQNDGDGTLSISAIDWEPNDYEMAGVGNTGPTLATHHYFIQYLTKNVDEEAGRRQVNDVSRYLRTMLADRDDLRVALAALTYHDSLHDRIERIQRWGVTGQRLDNALIDGTYVAASGTDFYVQTETLRGF